MIGLRSICIALSHSIRAKQKKEFEAHREEEARREAQRILDEPRQRKLRAIRAIDKAKADKWREIHARHVNWAVAQSQSLYVEDLRTREDLLAEIKRRAESRERDRLRKIAERQDAAADVGGVRAAAKAALAKQMNDEWAAEQQRRELAALDLDGSRAAARRVREEELERERLDFLTAQLVRRTA